MCPWVPWGGGSFLETWVRSEGEIGVWQRGSSEGVPRDQRLLVRRGSFGCIHIPVRGGGLERGDGGRIDSIARICMGRGGGLEAGPNTTK